MNNASEGVGIPVDLFEILKHDGVKALQSIWQKVGKLSGGYRTGNSQVSFQSQRKAMPKNAQTSSHACK